MEKFEEQLTRMTKPQMSNLKHQDMLEKAIINAKDKAALSWWWESIPLYIIAAFVMKTFFVRDTTLISNIHNMAVSNPYAAFLFFVVIPVMFIAINIRDIRKIYLFSGRPGIPGFIKTVWFNALIILTSIFILMIYSL